MKRIVTKEFCAPEGKKIKLSKWPTLVKAKYGTNGDYHKYLEANREELSKLQNLHYASNRNALLLIFQGMDACGKDGTIKHVMSGVNPQGCQVHSFKHPSASELEHDFLWRTTQRLPERGQIGIFNRSYYEEVLIVRVHPEILKAQGIEYDTHRIRGEKSIWKERFKSITDFESHMNRNGTKIIKFFLHLSFEEQTRRFLDRIDDPEKNWKLSPSDITERGFFQEYMKAYEDCIQSTSTKESPWYIVPADDKHNARMIVSQIIVDVLANFEMSYPKVSDARAKELLQIRKQLTSFK